MKIVINLDKWHAYAITLLLTIIAGAFLAAGAAPAGVSTHQTLFTDTIKGKSGDNVAVMGNVGIGTTMPRAKLHLYAPSSNSFMDIETAGPYASGLLIGAATSNSMKEGQIQYTDIFRIINRRFLTDNTDGGRDIMTFQPEGNVGIGTTNPLTRLHTEGQQISTFTGTARGLLTLSAPYNVGYYTPLDFLYTPGAYPTARIAAYHDGGGSKLVFGTSYNYAAGITTTAMTIDQYGKVGILQTNPQRTLQVGGDILTEGDFYDGGMPAVNGGWDVWMETGTGRFGTAPASSRRYKENIENSTLGLNDVMRLRPVLFNYKKSYVNDSTRHAGLIAEEVSEVSPMLVQLKDGRVEDVKYKEITPLLVKAIQEQQAQIKSLQNRLEELEKR
ncbi:MAG: tail fiber domain-containing protein [Nanoarchaeota archaeon]